MNDQRCHLCSAPNTDGCECAVGPHFGESLVDCAGCGKPKPERDIAPNTGALHFAGIPQHAPICKTCIQDQLKEEPRWTR